MTPAMYVKAGIEAAAKPDIQRLDSSAEHIERIRQKTATAEGIGPFWRSILLGALNTIDFQRKMSDTYGLALLMIREGCAEPAKVAGEAFSKARPALDPSSIAAEVSQKEKQG